MFQIRHRYSRERRKSYPAPKLASVHRGICSRAKWGASAAGSATVYVRSVRRACSSSGVTALRRRRAAIVSSGADIRWRREARVSIREAGAVSARGPAVLRSDLRRIHTSKPSLKSLECQEHFSFKLRSWSLQMFFFMLKVIFKNFHWGRASAKVRRKTVYSRGP